MYAFLSQRKTCSQQCSGRQATRRETENTRAQKKQVLANAASSYGEKKIIVIKIKIKRLRGREQISDQLLFFFLIFSKRFQQKHEDN